MITFTARLRILPGKEELALQGARAMAEAVREREPGALAYVCHRSGRDPQELVFFEVYADQESREAHDKTPHFAALVSAFGDVFDEDYGVEIEDLERVAGFVRAE